MKIARISCSKLKKSYRCPARELYSPSRLFSLSYQYAKQHAEQIYILSAKYGLLSETDVVSPYNLTLANLPPRRQQDWAAYVLKQLREKCNPDDEFIILAGKNYYQNLIPHLSRYSLPLGNLRIGPRLEFLQKQLGSSAAVSEERKSNVDLCFRLHQLLNALPKYTWQDIPSVSFQNGIYIVFERGETYRGMPRIVRVGTHNAPNRLKPRLTDHFVKENRNGSIFRKNIGKALLNRDRDPYLKIWTLDTSRPPHLGAADPEREKETEKRVSRYLRENMTFAVFPVETKEQRLRMEEAVIASLHHGFDFAPSDKWLGRFSPEPEIYQSGLWLKQGLDGAPLSEQEFQLLEQMVSSGSHLSAQEAYVPALKQGISESTLIQQTAVNQGKPMDTAEIRQYILQKLRTAQAMGEDSCTLVSGQIHKELGLKNKMPPVCNAMRQVMGHGDIELPTTARSGLSSTIKIQYQLAGRVFPHQ